jgi:cell division transport system permease protein
MRMLRYAFDEALASLWRRRQSGLLAMGTITIALFVLGAFLIVTTNLDRLGAEWGRAAELSVYVADDITPEQRHTVELAVAQDEVAAGQEFLTKADALRRFKQTFADLAASVDNVGGNPLPASVEVRLKPGAAGGPGVERLAAKLRQLPGVTDVQYDRQWLARMMSGIRIIRGAGFALGALLTVAAALTIANVVRLALIARRDELEIMQLVGAPHAYIRGPFVMEGVIQGGMGAALAVLALGVAFAVVQARYLGTLAAAINVSSLQFLSVGVCLGLVVGGMAVGCVGGLVAARRS